MSTAFVSDALWAIIAPPLPPERPKPKGGRPRIADRAALTEIGPESPRLSSGDEWPQPLAVSLACARTVDRTLCTLPTQSYLGVPSSVVRLGTSTNASWTRCRALELGSSWLEAAKLARRCTPRPVGPGRPFVA